jgi:decaprenylphospho-beta-D-erythro-pentofuranosid-2-ulose 2-reductase
MSETRGVIIVGATSGIGRAITRRLAEAGYSLILAGRDLDALDEIAIDVQVRFGGKAEARRFEALEFDGHAVFFNECIEAFAGKLSGLVLCHGQMPEQDDAARDFALARRMIEVNYLSSVSLLGLAATYFESAQEGFIAAITSVAGDRGRASNYLYGSSKSALSTVLAGLRVRLAKSGVGVVDVRPGFVDTQLTWGRPGMFLVASPDRVAQDVYRGIVKNRAVVYTPFFWAAIMAVIRRIPDVVFRRLSL